MTIIITMAIAITTTMYNINNNDDDDNNNNNNDTNDNNNITDDPQSYYSTAERLVRETPNSFQPNQYHNPNNPEAHYETTGPEIWEQTNGQVTHFVAGAGTGGTIRGVGKFLKEKNNNIQIMVK